MSVHRFCDLGTVIDDVHALFDEWTASGFFAPVLDADGAEVFRLAVHEWIANLVQHAAFRQARPEITLTVEVGPAHIDCVIEDNSLGFDFERQIEKQQALLSAPAPSERGRGLLMLITCTRNLAFEPAAPPPATRPQRLAFAVPATGAFSFGALFGLGDAGDRDEPLGLPHDSSEARLSDAP